MHMIMYGQGESFFPLPESNMAEFSFRPVSILIWQPMETNITEKIYHENKISTDKITDMIIRIIKYNAGKL